MSSGRPPTSRTPAEHAAGADPARQVGEPARDPGFPLGRWPGGCRQRFQPGVGGLERLARPRLTRYLHNPQCERCGDPAHHHAADNAADHAGADGDRSSRGEPGSRLELGIGGTGEPGHRQPADGAEHWRHRRLGDCGSDPDDQRGQDQHPAGRHRAVARGRGRADHEQRAKAGRQRERGRQAAAAAAGVAAVRQLSHPGQLNAARAVPRRSSRVLNAAAQGLHGSLTALVLWPGQAGIGGRCVACWAADPGNGCGLAGPSPEWSPARLPVMPFVARNGPGRLR